MNCKEIELLKSLNIDPDLRSWFFKQAKHLKWFYPLKKGDFFEPSENMPDVLPYLEKISLQLKDAPQYANELIDIIGSIVNYYKGRKINNEHIWWSCLKIFNNIPIELILENKTLNCERFDTWIRQWTSEDINGTLIASDLSTKLLSKLLENENTVKYAEVIVKVITEIEKGERQHALTSREEAALSNSPYWVLEGLKKNAQKIGEVCSKDVVCNIAEKLKKAFEYKLKTHFVDIRAKSGVLKIKVERKEKEKLKEKEIGFEDNKYVVSVVLLRDKEPETLLKDFSVIAVSKKEFLQEVKNNIPDGINLQGVSSFEDDVENLYDGLFEDFSHIWCRSLDAGPAHPKDAEDVLTIVLKDVLLSKCEHNKDEGKEILEKFLREEYRFPIFRRFVILCMDKHWKLYREFFDDVIENIPNILEESEFEVEFYDLLKNHCTGFSDEQIGKIKSLIDNVPEYYLEDDRKRNLWKFKWYSPLKGSDAFREEYEKAKESYKPENGKPYEPWRSHVEMGWVGHKSPLRKEEILKMPIRKLTKFLNEFEGSDPRQSIFEDQPDREGLTDEICKAVKEDSGRFEKELESFILVPDFYLKNILRGFKDAWDGGKNLDWSKFFQFFLNYVKDLSQEKINAAYKDNGDRDCLRVLESIAGLIEAGCTDASRGFGPEYFEVVEEIFNSVFALLKSEEGPVFSHDAITCALNTAFGRIIISFIVFSLRVKRENKLRSESWGEDKYEPLLSKGAEAYIWLGRYLPNIIYIDKKYVEGKIEDFYRLESGDPRWLQFMEGFLMTRQITTGIYKLMRSNYEKALVCRKFPKHVKERLVQHITLGYLDGCEELDEKNKDGECSLFRKLLNDSEGEEARDIWVEAVRFFWEVSGRKLGDEEIVDEGRKARIIEFWRWAYKNQAEVEEKLGGDYSIFLAHMAELTILLDKIDKEKQQWLLLSAEYIDEKSYHHISSFFLEYLTKFKDQGSIKRIGKILLKTLKKTVFTYRKEDIKLIVKRMYELWLKDKDGYLKVKEEADEICNTYGRRGFHFLRELFEEYNKGT